VTLEVGIWEGVIRESFGSGVLQMALTSGVQLGGVNRGLIPSLLPPSYRAAVGQQSGRGGRQPQRPVHLLRAVSETLDLATPQITLEPSCEAESLGQREKLLLERLPFCNTTCLPLG
jgi:hypothetical protein